MTNGGNRYQNRSERINERRAYGIPDCEMRGRGGNARSDNRRSSGAGIPPGGYNGKRMPPGRNPYRRTYHPYRSPGSGNKFAAFIIVVLLIIIAASVAVSVRSCTIREKNNAAYTDGAGNNGGAGDTDNTGNMGNATVSPGTVDDEKFYDTDNADKMLIGTAEPKPENKLRICVDPGHGYDDVGTQSENLLGKSEKDINLEVALKLVPLLEYEGFDVIMTRNSDIPPDYINKNQNGQYLINPTWRSEYANRNGVDLYISLHCNSYDSPATSGTRIYYCSDSAYRSSEFADMLASSISNIMNVPAPEPVGYDSDNAYTVTKRVNAPSVLVEMGFVTNPGDAKNLLDSEWQQDMALALAKGIKQYLTK